MSNRYRLDFLLSTRDDEVATMAVLDVARMIDDSRCIVEHRSSRPARAGLLLGWVEFLAANDAEAEDLKRRAQTLPGLPPMDSVSWRRLKVNA